MPLTFNIRHLDQKEVHLQGELPASELDLDGVDDLIHARSPVRYDLSAQRVGQAILAQGRLEATLDCECSRCLKSFRQKVVLDPWITHLPLEGPEKAPIQDDFADLTPYVREDILLEFPQHPLCKPDCGGLPNRGKVEKAKGARPSDASSAWSELNKLKF
jgi:uncharacterized protein